MASKNHPNDEPLIGNWSLSLDWLDLLILIVIVTAAISAQHALGLDSLRPRYVGLMLAPLVLGALVARRKLLPVRRAPVKKGLTLVGVLSLFLMVPGVIVGAFGAFMWWRGMQEEPPRVDESLVQMEAELRASATPLEVVPVVDGVALPSDHGEPSAGDTEALFAALRDAKTPSTDVLARHKAEVRHQHEEELATRFAERRAENNTRALWCAAISALAIVLGGFLDSRRARHAPTPEGA
ncbi:hypothetical protein [Chondromyces crocatus]|uniref:Uncharacterized protein n=1 Tax=Chondromyces crocatus TaxID=52 RepID=A0A0K1EMW0_CHOCO|nr:hypothetical protein [Chondromyces crocatus]AKT42235.1 uncharacterized protein CMC5_064580 [Chondromyces crocatus]